MLDTEQQKTLAIMAGTLAQWLRDNTDEAVEQTNEEGEADADAFGMRAMAIGYLRLYKECIDAGIITPITHVQSTATKQ